MLLQASSEKQLDFAIISKSRGKAALDIEALAEVPKDERNRSQPSAFDKEIKTSGQDLLVIITSNFCNAACDSPKPTLSQPTA
jgi:hypothetical protein